MYAIVEIAGQQFKVQQNDEIFVHRLESEPGAKIEFEHVLLLDNNGKITIGKPLVDGASISGQVLDHVRGDKVVVFKKKRRKGFEKETGHRQDFTKVKIEAIHAKGRSKKAADKEEVPAESNS